MMSKSCNLHSTVHILNWRNDHLGSCSCTKYKKIRRQIAFESWGQEDEEQEEGLQSTCLNGGYAYSGWKLRNGMTRLVSAFVMDSNTDACAG